VLPKAAAPHLDSTKTGKAQCEQMFSAVHPTTDIAKILRHVRFVPILLQKSQKAERLISRQITKQATIDDQ
jgi:hypothetical protein